MSRDGDPFLPIDATAKDGSPYLLRAADGTLHSGRWTGSAWVYAAGVAINRPITHYRPQKGKSRHVPS